MPDLPPPCEDLLSEQYRSAWCTDTDVTGRYVCRRVKNHALDFHAARNSAGGIHQWPAAVPAPAPELPVYGVAPDNVHHEDVVTAKELWEAIKPQFDPNDAWEYTELGPLLRTFVAVLDRRRAEIAADAGGGDLRQQIVTELDGMVSEFIHPNEFGGYDVDYGDFADIALAVVQPVLEHQAAEVQQLRAANASLLAMLERMETLHVTFHGPDGEEYHPDWCRECRVDNVRAELDDVLRQRDDWWNQRAAECDEARQDRDAARRERDEMRQERDQARIEFGFEQLRTEGALSAADRWAREAERLAIPAETVRLPDDWETQIRQALHAHAKDISEAGPLPGTDSHDRDAERCADNIAGDVVVLINNWMVAVTTGAAAVPGAPRPAMLRAIADQLGRIAASGDIPHRQEIQDAADALAGRQGAPGSPWDSWLSPVSDSGTTVERAGLEPEAVRPGLPSLLRRLGVLKPGQRVYVDGTPIASVSSGGDTAEVPGE